MKNLNLKKYGWQYGLALFIFAVNLLLFFEYRRYGNPGYDIWNLLANILLAGFVAIPYDASKGSRLYYARLALAILAFVINLSFVVTRF